ncbi:MAG: tetratricopeptide repeat-containing protein kinase family protein [Ignavibacteriaceae bacterium]
MAVNFTQEYVDGVSLLDNKSLEDENILREILKQICSALFYLHQSNYIYYDFKAENILVTIVNGKPHIKIIDFGFARNIYENEEYEIRGTAEYIAPEILKKEDHDYRVDLYALGILLYKIVYGDFPFDIKVEIDIYKAHLEKEFEFPESKYSPELINIIKKLLSKDPNERYAHSIQILFDLGIEVNNEIKNNFLPARIIADRKDSFNILKTYIGDEQSSEVFTVKGLEDAGKTTLLFKIYSEFDNTVFIRVNKLKSGLEFLKKVLKKIFYTEFVYQKLSKDVIDSVEKIFITEQQNILEDIRAAFNQISIQSKFILLLDDFNKYDDFTLEIFKEIIPILQVNNIKIILTETSDINYASGFLFNVREVNLMPFTDVQLEEFFDNSYAPFFPKDKLRKNVLLYADLLPGSVISFIKDCLVLNLIEYTYQEILIKHDDQIVNLLKSSHEAIYNVRIKPLTEEEIFLAQMISMFNIVVDKNILSLTIDQPESKLLKTIIGLSNKNIIYAPSENMAPYFSSDGLKNFVYSTIKNKKDLHLKIGKILIEKFPNTDCNEIARHFELGEDYLKSYNILQKELEEAERLSAFSYRKKILLHLLTFPLNTPLKIETNIHLCNIYYKLGEFKEALSLIENLLPIGLTNNQENNLLGLKGILLIETGEVEEGINLLNSLINKIDDENVKPKLSTELARGYLDLNQFTKVDEICNNLLNSDLITNEEMGKCYNLLGLLEIYRDNNLDKALQYFISAEKTYENSNLKLKLAVIQMNIGNVYNIKGKYDLAEEYWNKSMKTNYSVGNLEHEAGLLVNFGIFNYNKLDFDKSLEVYNRSKRIYSNIGKKEGNGIVLINLCEIYTVTCEYSNAIQSIKEAYSIFNKLKNSAEEIESLFLMSEVYFILGDFEEFLKILLRLDKKINETEESEKNNLYKEYLFSIKKLIEGNLDDSIKSFSEIRGKFVDLEDNSHYFKSTMLLVKALLIKEDYNKSFHILNEETLINLCKNNFLFEAERNYMLGLLADSASMDDLNSSIDYFERSLNLIKDEVITEITWKILLRLSENYLERGDYNKAKEYALYGGALINFIADNIKNDELKEKYLFENERNKTLEKFGEVDLLIK